MCESHLTPHIQVKNKETDQRTKCCVNCFAASKADWNLQVEKYKPESIMLLKQIMSAGHHCPLQQKQNPVNVKSEI